MLTDYRTEQFHITNVSRGIHDIYVRTVISSEEQKRELHFIHSGAIGFTNETLYCKNTLLFLMSLLFTFLYISKHRSQIVFPLAFGKIECANSS